MYINEDVVELMKFALDDSEAINNYSVAVRVAALEKAESILEENFETDIFDTILGDYVDDLGGISVSIDTDGDDLITVTFIDNDGKADSMEIEMSSDEISIELLEEHAEEYMSEHYLPVHDDLYEREDDDEEEDDDDIDVYFLDEEYEEDSIMDIIDYYETH